MGGKRRKYDLDAGDGYLEPRALRLEPPMLGVPKDIALSDDEPSRIIWSTTGRYEGRPSVEKCLSDFSRLADEGSNEQVLKFASTWGVLERERIKESGGRFSETTEIYRIYARQVDAMLRISIDLREGRKPPEDLWHQANVVKPNDFKGIAFIPPLEGEIRREVEAIIEKEKETLKKMWWDIPSHRSRPGPKEDNNERLWELWCQSKGVRPEDLRWPRNTIPPRFKWPAGFASPPIEFMGDFLASLIMQLLNEADIRPYILWCNGEPRMTLNASRERQENQERMRRSAFYAYHYLDGGYAEKRKHGDETTSVSFLFRTLVCQLAAAITEYHVYLCSECRRPFTYNRRLRGDYKRFCSDFCENKDHKRDMRNRQAKKRAEAKELKTGCAAE